MLRAFAIFLSLFLLVSCVQAQTLIGPTRPVTAPGVSGISADGGSFTPSFSADGHYLVFVSQANNLVTNDEAALPLDVFVRDLNTGVTRLVSVKSSGRGGGSGDSCYPTISSNGQFVAFISTATNLTANGIYTDPNIYVRDTIADTTSLASVSTGGSAGRGGYCVGLDTTPDGRFIVFSSTQTNLVTNSISPVRNLFLRDRQAGTTTLLALQAGATAGARGNSDFPVISADGQRVAFYSEALDLISLGGPTNSGQVYLLDLTSSTTVWLGSNAQPFFSGIGMRSINAALSSAGNAAAFIATNSSKSALFYYDVTNQQTFLVNSNVDAFAWPEISADGRRVAYVARSNVFAWDAQWSSNILVSVDMNGSSNGVSLLPAISADGSRVAFVSNATNLTANATNGEFQLFVRDVDVGVTRLASHKLSGGPSSDQQLCTPAISSDSQYVVFASGDNSLVADDMNGASDVFIWSWNTDQIQMISQKEVLKPSATDLGLPLFGSAVLSVDGRYIAFAALDGNLVSGDTNGWSDIFVRDMVTGNTSLASGDANESSATNGPAVNPSLSADGRYVAFLRGASSNSQTGNVYLRDLQSAALTLVTATNGIAAGNAAAPVVSPSGRYVAFHTSSMLATNDVNGKTDVYLYDSQLQTNILISVPANGQSANYDSLNPIFSPDEQWVVFQSKSPYLVTPSLQTTSLQLYAYNLFSNRVFHVSYAPSGAPFTGDNSNAVFSADSHFLAFKSATSASNNPICLHNMVTGVNQLVCTNCFSPSLNGDGSKVAFCKTNSQILQIYVMSVQTSQTNLVSVASDGVSFANGRSSEPFLTADGRFVLFLSKATNLSANDTNSLTDIFVRDLISSNTIVISTSQLGGKTGDYPAVNPVVAGNGRTIVFQSFAFGLSPNDFNASRDLFIVQLGIGDFDGDGMDDDWEMTYFGDLSHDGSVDSDGDGFTDLQEFVAGTNPTDNASMLRVIAVSRGVTTVYWSAVPGRSYRIDYNDSLSADGWRILGEAIPANSATAFVVDKSASASMHRFYRAVLVP